MYKQKSGTKWIQQMKVNIKVNDSYLIELWVHFISAKMATYTSTCDWIVNSIVTFMH